MRKNKTIALIIKNGETNISALSALLKEIKSKHDGHYYCLNYFHSFRTEDELKSHANVSKSYNYFYKEMPKK